jgi:aldehyde:ferredoxin oxidoreductase
VHGYVGKILRIDLTERKISTIDTKTCEKWGGGHGMGSALFFDLVKDKTIGPLDPRNVVTIMSSPLSGTLAPAVSARTEVQGVGLQSYPREWFTRSNFGGRFSGMLKAAGWDGIVLEGKADGLVWIDIRDGAVKIRDAAPLRGLDTWETQRQIWRSVSGGSAYGDWMAVGEASEGKRTTLRPAVLTIGPAGENQSRIASLIHDAASAAGQGGFGGVWGSKNLKAISVIGTGSISIADPKALLAARLWAKERYAFRIDDRYKVPGSFSFPMAPSGGFPLPPQIQSRPWGCLGCHVACRRKTEAGANESGCMDIFWYDLVGPMGSDIKQKKAALKATDLMQRAGINCIELQTAITYLRELNKQGIVGHGKEIDCNLPFERFGEIEFAERILRQIEKKEGVGEALHQGLARAAKSWGRLEKDLGTGFLPLQYWGYPEHYDARTNAEWGYGSILGDRDINEHDFNFACHWTPCMAIMAGQKPIVSAKQLSEIFAETCKPYNDPHMIDFSDEGIYSESMARTVAWHRRYTRFWKQSLGYCDYAYGDYVNPYGADFRGLTPEGEPKFFNAVTGRNLTFEEGMEIGGKIWNLDRAIWVLQGRHRDQEVFAAYTYDVASGGGNVQFKPPEITVVCEKGEWKYKDIKGRRLDRDRFEAWKTIYYKLEGWDPTTGWPRKSTLDALGLGYVADELVRHKRLGSG